VLTLDQSHQTPSAHLVHKSIAASRELRPQGALLTIHKFRVENVKESKKELVIVINSWFIRKLPKRISKYLKMLKQF
jgi:hypothetical protein